MYINLDFNSHDLTIRNLETKPRELNNLVLFSHLISALSLAINYIIRANHSNHISEKIKGTSEAVYTEPCYTELMISQQLLQEAKKITRKA